MKTTRSFFKYKIHVPWKKLLDFGGNLDLYVNAGIFKEFFYTN